MAREGCTGAPQLYMTQAFKQSAGRLQLPATTPTKPPDWDAPCNADMSQHAENVQPTLSRSPAGCTCMHAGTTRSTSPTAKHTPHTTQPPSSTKQHTRLSEADTKHSLLLPTNTREPAPQLCTQSGTQCSMLCQPCMLPSNTFDEQTLSAWHLLQGIRAMPQLLPAAKRPCGGWASQLRDAKSAVQNPA